MAAQKVLIQGESGSGKSFSIRNLLMKYPSSTMVVNVTDKPFPFRAKGAKVVSTDEVDKICGYMKTACEEKGIKSIVIDDAGYIMTDMFMDKAMERGYEKFALIGKKFFDLIHFVKTLPDDVIVYFIMHVEVGEDGKTRAKTIGKMLNDKVTLEGLFTTVLLCQTDGKKHVFVTQSDGTTTAKSPIDLFDAEIPNDLCFVDEQIREYYDMPLCEEATAK